MLSVFLILLSIFAHTDNSVKNQLDEYLKKNLSSYKDFQYEIVQMPSNIKEAEIIKTNEFNINGNMAYIPVKVITADKRTTKSIITIRLKLFKEVLVAAKPIKFREHLNAGDFQFEKKDVTGIRGKAVETEKGLDNLRSKINMKAGDVLVQEAVELIPVINVGDPVTASVNSGNVFISTDAVARQEGRPGDIIQILTKDKKIFKAKVIDSHNVLIIE